MRGGSARSRHVPSSAARDWDAESNKKADDDGVHDDDDDDDKMRININRGKVFRRGEEAPVREVRAERSAEETGNEETRGAERGGGVRRVFFGACVMMRDGDAGERARDDDGDGTRQKSSVIIIIILKSDDDEDENEEDGETREAWICRVTMTRRRTRAMKSNNKPRTT